MFLPRPHGFPWPSQCWVFSLCLQRQTAPRPPRLGQGPSLSQVLAFSNTTLQQENPVKGSRVLRRDHGKMSVRENRGKVIAAWALKGLLEGVT